MSDRSNISRRSLMGAGICTALGAGAMYAWRQFGTPMESAHSLSEVVPFTGAQKKSETLTLPASQEPKTDVPSHRWEWQPIVRLDERGRNTWPQHCEVSTYTPKGDGGVLKRPTAALNFGPGGLRENLGYPREYRTLEYINANQISICAIPYWAKWIHESLREYSGGAFFHRYRVRFPWYDPVGHFRIPVDRVPYRGKWRNPLPQRNRFDMFMYMPEKQARRHGVPLMPVEVFEQVKVKI